MNINPINALPIKTSLLKVIQYIKAQEIRQLSYVCNKDDIVAYKNSRRCFKLTSAIANEMSSFGPPFAIDGKTARSIPWRWHGVRRVFITITQVAMLERLLPCVEVYHSQQPGCVGSDYLGEALIIIKAVYTQRAPPSVVIPFSATFVYVVF
jgi:hypothetical protein